MKKKAVVIHSGGMDSSLCLTLAIKEFGNENVLSMSFNYGQRHSPELKQAAKICSDWNIDHVEIPIHCLQEITENALTNSSIPIEHPDNSPSNTLVTGRNGLMVRLGAIHAHHIGAKFIYMGVMEIEEANSGYRDCSRKYVDMMQEILRIDLDDPHFEIRTPLVQMLKKETMELGYRLGILEYLLKETISCYEGIPLQGCALCPACKLRNKGLLDFMHQHPDFSLPFAPELLQKNHP